MSQSVRTEAEALAVARLEVAQTVDDRAQAELAGALEWAVRMVRAELHRAVNVACLGDAVAYGRVRLVDDR